MLNIKKYCDSLTKKGRGFLQNYSRISACLKYQAYEFILPDNLAIEHYTALRKFVKSLGKNVNPPSINVLHIEHRLFFLDFPGYGFPGFKINFYKHTSAKEVYYYLNMIDSYLNEMMK